MTGFKHSKEYVSELLQREKLKRQVDKTQVTELVGHQADIMFELSESGVAISHFVDMMIELGQKRAMKRKRR